MKTGKPEVAAYYLNCPDCGESIDHPSGSGLLWLPSDPCRDVSTECFCCGRLVKIPARLRVREAVA